MGAGDEALQDYSSLNGVILIPHVQHYTQQSSFSFQQKELNKDGEDFGHTFKFYFFTLTIHFIIFPICFSCSFNFLNTSFSATLKFLL